MLSPCFLKEEEEEEEEENVLSLLLHS